MNEYYFQDYLNKNNIHPETYLDNKLLDIEYGEINNIPKELNNCLCCHRHSSSVMSLNLKNCRCPCRHFRRIIKNKLFEI